MEKLFDGGRFFVGCNWWASHAGTRTWKEWDASVVRADFKKLAAAGLTVIRVFPLWDDFQPLRMHFGGADKPKELRMREDPLPETEAGRAGVDEAMADRFLELCDIASEEGLQLIVGLITGWMSGRMHSPEAFGGMNLLRDPLPLTWQTKFVKYMVKRFKTHPAIVAWDLGNECNNLGDGLSREECYVWASLITNTIRSEDRSRPVISGMHGTLPGENTTWRAGDLGEILDVLCTHPYPLFTPHCGTDPINGVKSALHATAESVMYATTGGIPCFVEEAGTLGPMISNEAVAADYVRVSAFSALVHDLHGYLWWCANEQSHLTHTPYDWDSVERELGLFHSDGTAKPVLGSLTEIAKFENKLEGKLPPRITDALCILTHGQDEWANAYGSFILAKEAGIDVEFAWCDDEYKKADTYILPGLSGLSSISLHKYRELLSRVKEDGATLYMSIKDALLSPFTEISGLSVTSRSQRASMRSVTLPTGEVLPLKDKIFLDMDTVGAEVLLRDEDGGVLLSEYKYGRGRVVVLTSALEELVATVPASAASAALPYYKIYGMALKRSGSKIAMSSSPFVCLTEHPIDGQKRIISVINYTPVSQKVRISLDGYSYERSLQLHGEAEISAFDGGIELTLSNNNGLLIYVNKN